MQTLLKLLKYKDMNSNREKRILINPYQSAATESCLCCGWMTVPALLAPHFPDNNSCYVLKGPGVAKLSKMKGQFSFSHLHLFLSIVKESLLF